MRDFKKLNPSVILQLLRRKLTWSIVHQTQIFHPQERTVNDLISKAVDNGGRGFSPIHTSDDLRLSQPSPCAAHGYVRCQLTSKLGCEGHTHVW